MSIGFCHSRQGKKKKLLQREFSSHTLRQLLLAMQVVLPLRISDESWISDSVRGSENSLSVRHSEYVFLMSCLDLQSLELSALPRKFIAVFVSLSVRSRYLDLRKWSSQRQCAFISVNFGMVRRERVNSVSLAQVQS